MNNNIPIKRKTTAYRLAIAALICIFFSSCYSVRVVNRDSVPEPDPMNRSADFYRGFKVHSLDTTIKLKLTDEAFSRIVPACSDKGFYCFEYRVTLGGVLLSGVTLGKLRKVKIKYVCVKE